MASRFEAEIRRTAEKAASDLDKVAARVEAQMADMRAEMRQMRMELTGVRDKGDSNYLTLSDKIDKTNDKLSAKIDETNDKLSARIDETNDKLGNLDRKVTEIGSKLNALLWAVAGLGSLITIAITVGTAFHWL
jgi:chromosome segregation ATPase